MSSSLSSLDAAATDRKARLAKLASLKRKRPGSDTTVSEVQPSSETSEVQTSETNQFLSGRNYDAATQGPKLGFENTPQSKQETVERLAERISSAAAEQAAKDDAETEKGIDLFKLQPKKPNWDLKRDLAEKMKIVDVKTQNAIARLVRERIEKAKNEALSKGNVSLGDDGEEVGVEGNTLLEAIHQREREEEDIEQRDRDTGDNESMP